MNLDELRKLAGLGGNSATINNGSNVSLTGSEKRRLEREHNIKPGTPEWFQLWFSRPYLTGEQPVSESPVSDLKKSLEADKKELVPLSKDELYDKIDSIMTKVAKKHNITGKELHNLWVKKFNSIPDVWIKSK